MQENLITVKTFNNHVEANLLKTKFDNDGIECAIFHEILLTLLPVHNVAFGGIKLKIKRDSLEETLKILNEINNAPLTDDNNEIISCPDCESTDFYIGFKSFKGFWGVFGAIISFLYPTFYPPVLCRRVYKCKDCGFCI